MKQAPGKRPGSKVLRRLLVRNCASRVTDFRLAHKRIGGESMPNNIAGKLLLGGAVVGGALATVASFGMRPDSQMFGHTLVAGNDADELALTYDDGPNDRSTPELLEVLDRYNVKATFFVIGKFVREQPQLVRELHRAGHVVGNHTMTHPFLANKPQRFIREELRSCNEVLENTLGAPVRYFRAPFGARRPAVLRCARELGLVPVQWNAQGNDWEPIGTAAMVRRLERGVQRARKAGRGSNILLHDGFDKFMSCDRSDSVRATEQLLQKALGEGMRAVTVDAWG